jgi:hypothetical protein
MAEDNRLDRRAVPKVQRQNVHERRAGDKGERGSGQPAKKISYFHAVYLGAIDDRTDLEDPLWRPFTSLSRINVWSERLFQV